MLNRAKSSGGLHAPKFMKIILHSWLLFVGAVIAFNGHAADLVIRREWNVNGVPREALIYAPPTAKTNATPVVFAFHGHGGTMERAARMFDYHTEWREAIVVYMQGLNTPGRLTDPEGKRAGWQHAIGDQADRDLKFFDAVLASLKRDYRVNEKRIYATGHSHGGGFTYLLWAARGDPFAAFAPSACVARALVSTDTFPLPSDGRGTKGEAESNSAGGDKTNAAESRKFLPKPVLHLAAENDPLVKFEWQKLSIDALRKLSQCGEGKPWEQEPRCTIYKSKVGAPVVTYIHQGKHAFPPNASAIIVKFFKEHPER
jgi:polyhydroxybutyrate depolymerase